MKYYISLMCIYLFFPLVSAAYALDCNNNGAEDSQDIQNGISKDCNLNNIPDECDVSASGFLFSGFKEFSTKKLTIFGFDQTDALMPSRVADFNGDGKPDLWGSFSYSAFGGYNYIFVYLNQGDNTFSDPLEFYYAGSLGFTQLSIADPIAVDIDSDNDIDIVFRTDTVAWRQVPPASSFTVSVLRNDGSGNFTREETNIPSLLPTRSSTVYWPSKLISASFASANSKDLAMIHEGRVYALYNVGNLQFVKFDMGPVNQADRLAFLPDTFNRSSTAVFSEELQESSLYAPGDGSLQRETFGGGTGFTDIKRLIGNSIRTNVHLARGSQPTPENTGFSSIMTQQYSGGPSAFYSSGVGGVNEIHPPVDFDGNGAEDVILFSKTSEAVKKGAEILLNDGNNDFSNRLRIFLPATLDRAIAVHDFNNDGKPDILFRSKTPDKMIIGFSGATGPLTTALEADKDANSIPDVCERATPGDYNGNRTGDRVVVRDYSSQLVWLISDTDRFLTQGSEVIPFGLRGDTVLGGDFNGEEKNRPGVVRKVGDYLYWYWVKRDGTTSFIIYGLKNDIPLTGHFNSDKFLDRVVVREHLGGLLWLINTIGGDHAVAQGGVHQFGLTGDIPFTADMDGDGISELVVSRTLRSGQIVWYALVLKSAEVLGPYPWGLKGDLLMPPSDLDGNGKAEYLVARPINGFLNTFYNSPLRGQTGSFLAVQKLFGLPGDHLHVSYRLGLPYPQLGVWRPANLFWIQGLQFSEYWDSIGNSLGNAQYGFTTDILVGVDGKAVRKYPL